MTALASDIIPRMLVQQAALEIDIGRPPLEQRTDLFADEDKIDPECLQAQGWTAGWQSGPSHTGQ